MCCKSEHETEGHNPKVPHTFLANATRALLSQARAYISELCKRLQIKITTFCGGIFFFFRQLVKRVKNVNKGRIYFTPSGATTSFCTVPMMLTSEESQLVISSGLSSCSSPLSGHGCSITSGSPLPPLETWSHQCCGSLSQQTMGKVFIRMTSPCCGTRWWPSGPLLACTSIILKSKRDPLCESVGSL